MELDSFIIINYCCLETRRTMGTAQPYLLIFTVEWRFSLGGGVSRDLGGNIDEVAVHRK